MKKQSARVPHPERGRVLSPPNDAAALKESPPRRDALALLIFLVLTCGMTNPLVLHIASAVEDTQDALLNTWIVAWVGHALIADPLNLFNANIFYPYLNTLAFSETMLPQGLFALPFNLAFDNTALGYNLVLLGSFFLAAYAMYLFVLDLTRRRGAAIVAGVIFAFNPYNLGNLAQVQLLSFGWLPLAMMYLRRVLYSDSGGAKLRPAVYDLRTAFLFALFFSLQALSSFYYAFLAGLAVALRVIWFFAAKWRDRRDSLSRPSVPLLRVLARLSVATLLAALLVLPFFLPYLRVQRDLGFQRKIEESEPFSASLKMYAQVSRQNVLYGDLLQARPPIFLGGYPLDDLFPGFVAIALGINGIVASRIRERWFYLILVALAFILSLGPRLYIAPSVSTSITLPYRWLYDAFPLLRALRAPVRFDALVMFALAVLAGFGAHKAESTSHALRAEGGRGLPFSLIASRPLSSLLVVLAALEYLALPAANTAPVPVGDGVAQVVRWLVRQPQTTILELPMIASDPNRPLDLTTQYLSTYHWQRTPDGYSGFNPPKRGEIAYEMQFFPGERAISLLQALDVQYVIVHGDQRTAWNPNAGDLQLVQQFGGDHVYRVTPREQNAMDLRARVHLPQPAAPKQSYFAYVIVENRAPRSFAIKPTDTLQIDARWSDGTAQRVTAALPLVTTSVSVTPVALLAPPQVGDYRLDLRVSGNEIGEWDLAGDVAVRNEEPAHQIVLPAQAVLSAPFKSSYAPGDAVAILLVWLPLNKIDAYYSASVRVVDARGDKIVQEDRQPVTETMLWSPGSAVPDRFILTLPRDLAPGEYSVQLLMYQAEQGTEALLLDQDYAPSEKITLGMFTVK